MLNWVTCICFLQQQKEIFSSWQKTKPTTLISDLISMIILFILKVYKLVLITDLGFKSNSRCYLLSFGFLDFFSFSRSLDFHSIYYGKQRKAIRQCAIHIVHLSACYFVQNFKCNKKWASFNWIMVFTDSFVFVKFIPELFYKLKLKF